MVFDNYLFVGAHAKKERNCNAVVTRPMIMWSSTWSNMWPTDIIFLEANKPYFYYYQTRHCHSRSETSIELTALKARHGHHQLVDQRSETSTNIAIILIDAIYKEFYKCWSRCPALASAHNKTSSQPYESLIKLLACAISSKQCKRLSASGGIA